MVRWEYIRSSFRGDSRNIVDSAQSNLSSATKHITLREDLPRPDLKHANFVAAHRQAQREYGLHHRRDDRCLRNCLTSAIRRYTNELHRQRWRKVCTEIGHFASSTHI